MANPVDKTTDGHIDPAGSRELAKAAAAWLACVAFAVTFLVATYAGAQTVTALIRGGLAAFAVQVTFGWLLRPAMSVVLEAMARDRAAQQAAAEAAAQEAEA